MRGVARAERRRIKKFLRRQAGDQTYGGLLPSECRFTPAAGRLDVYTTRVDINPDDLRVVNKGVQGVDNLTELVVSHVAAGVSATGRGADAEQAFVAAMQVLRGRLVLVRLEREAARKGAGAADVAATPADR